VFSRQLYKVAAYDLFYIKNVLEGYDNVTVMTTVSAKEGIFELVYPEGMALEVKRIIEKIKEEVQVEEV